MMVLYKDITKKNTKRNNKYYALYLFLIICPIYLQKKREVDL